MTSALLDLARAHAPYLIVAAPLAGAALNVVSPSARLSWAIASLAGAIGALIAIDLASRLLLSTAAPPALVSGIAGLRPDGVGAWAAAVLASAGALIAAGAGALIRGDFSARTAPLALALGSIAVAGWCGAALAGDFIGVFIASQTAWLAGVGLLAMSAERSRGALSGALRTLVSGGLSAALMLLGLGFIARGLGSIDLAAVAEDAVAAPELVGAGFGLVLSALALQAAVAPLHLWAGAAYSGAGGIVALTMACVTSVGALAVLLRIAAFALSSPAIAASLSAVLLSLGLLSVVVGSVQAIGARNLRRLVAYAGVAQAGCVLASLALGSLAGVAAALVQVLSQAAAALALLGGGACVAGANSMRGLDGLARRAPVSSAAITLGALSLMGAPLTLGFLGRWRLIEAGVGGGWWWAASVVIVASLAAVIYGGRLIERIFFRRAAAPGETGDAWRLSLAPALIAAMAAIAAGLEPSLILRAADAAAASLFAGAP